MNLRILMIEKDATTADLLVPSLERKGHEVFVCRSLRPALARIRSSWYPDLLIVDVASFGQNGYKVRDGVRAHLEGVPTILLLEEGHAGAGSDAEAFMTRPFGSRALLHRVKKIAENLTSREICEGSLCLDPETRVLRKGDRVFYLRPKESALLALFMRNSGQVLTRSSIIREIWETEYVDDTRTLTVHVRWLREKIEEDPHRPRILRTIRGVGYRFEVLPAP